MTEAERARDAVGAEGVRSARMNNPLDTDPVISQPPAEEAKQSAQSNSGANVIRNFEDVEAEDGARSFQQEEVR